MVATCSRLLPLLLLDTAHHHLLSLLHGLKTMYNSSSAYRSQTRYSHDARRPSLSRGGISHLAHYYAPRIYPPPVVLSLGKGVASKSPGTFLTPSSPQLRCQEHDHHHSNRCAPRLALPIIRPTRSHPPRH